MNGLLDDIAGMSLFVFVKYWPPGLYRQCDPTDSTSLHVPFEFLYESDECGAMYLPAVCVRRFVSASVSLEDCGGGLTDSRYFYTLVKHESGSERLMSYVQDGKTCFINAGFIRSADEILALYTEIVSRNLMSAPDALFSRQGRGIFSRWNIERISDFIGIQAAVLGL